MCDCYIDPNNVELHCIRTVRSLRVSPLSIYPSRYLDTTRPASSLFGSGLRQVGIRRARTITECPEVILPLEITVFIFKSSGPLSLLKCVGLSIFIRCYTNYRDTKDPHKATINCWMDGHGADAFNLRDPESSCVQIKSVKTTHLSF